MGRQRRCGALGSPCTQDLYSRVSASLVTPLPPSGTTAWVCQLLPFTDVVTLECYLYSHSLTSPAVKGQLDSHPKLSQGHSMSHSLPINIESSPSFYYRVTNHCHPLPSPSHCHPLTGHLAISSYSTASDIHVVSCHL